MTDEEETGRTYAAEQRWHQRNSAYIFQLDRKKIDKVSARICKRAKVEEPQIVISTMVKDISFYNPQDRMIMLALGWGQWHHVLLHELSHHISKGLSHDDQFRGALCRMIELEFGKSSAIELRTEYGDEGLEIAKASF